MATTVSYKGSTIATVSNQTKTLTTSGKYMEADVIITDSSSGGGGGSSKNVQIAPGIGRVKSTSYINVSGQSISVNKTGVYDVYWVGYRARTSGDNGSQLYIDDSAYDSEQTTFDNAGQAVHLSSVSLTAYQTITVRARSASTSYYMYVGNLTIVEQ